ncbi:MAG: hypothetical protein AAF092_07685 [Pseudomonadota bacterium]
MRVLIVLAALAAAPAHAQTFDEVRAVVEEITLENIQAALCQPNANCAPATEAERATYPLPEDMSRAVMEVAIRSYAAQTCGLDPDQVSFIPMMQGLRSSGDFSDRELAFVGVQHGVTFGFLEQSSQFECNAAWRQEFGME